MTGTSVDATDERTTRNGERNAAPERERSECPECTGRIAYDEEHGERACADCGLVLDADGIDYGPEWRRFDDDGDDRCRVGAPVTARKHDKGLSTTIGWQDEDAYGNRISGRKRRQLQRLRTWNERFTSKNARERNLKQALGEIERMASALGLPEPCRETAGVIYRRAVEEELLPGRSIEAMATACLYAAARQQGTPRTLVAFASVSRVEKLPIQRAYRYLSSELGLKIEPADPIHYLPQYASELGVGDETERLARKILEAAKDRDLHSGRSPAGLAAAAIYGAGRLTDEGLTQERIGEETGVSGVTVRNRYRELLDAYGATRDR
ncbi:Transcription factor TFIIB cyclin-related protein [Natrinema pellirubrum DSM 15624]|uniref:Transcription initiation factor IIB n=1 Tax=Natrinema pellirubrum (strain DSM 15624 / CIP 106293 / JCM 10476 / NCIMB 786 / 157) TaxID=797303 RepID=L0JL46_NATP1|nr:TFIIB-type zinc ribbon-containing protein [Natrinema pellirubrum]AGB31994.1 transcription initiation factor TFIIIB, Brf1 subunit/transcription initiation factor TFIIB [Natrinema pellirubrum DSM 15624]ELY78139.1 Transcription factor TFIIB cyclin-related protein [Natrinema pellirubrum DSM 15624]